jgi:ribosomal protein S18
MSNEYEKRTMNGRPRQRTKKRESESGYSERREDENAQMIYSERGRARVYSKKVFNSAYRISLDYKNAEAMHRFITDRVNPAAPHNGTCAKHQRQLSGR